MPRSARSAVLRRMRTGPSLRVPDAAEQSWFRGGSNPVAGARHRSEYGDLLAARRGAAEVIAGRKARRIIPAELGWANAASPAVFVSSVSAVPRRGARAWLGKADLEKAAKSIETHANLKTNLDKNKSMEQIYGIHSEELKARLALCPRRDDCRVGPAGPGGAARVRHAENLRRSAGLPAVTICQPRRGLSGC